LTGSQGLSGQDAKELTAEQKEARVNLVASLVAGLTVALGGDSAVATLAAQIETENNYLGQKPERFLGCRTAPIRRGNRFLRSQGSRCLQSGARTGRHIGATRQRPGKRLRGSDISPVRRGNPTGNNEG